MRAVTTTLTGLAAALLLAASTPVPASAQTPVAKKAIAKVEKALTRVANACVTDIRSYCGAVTPGDGRLAFCLAAHEDKVSNGCYSALLDVARDIDIAANRIAWTVEVCNPDIVKYCGNVAEGQGRIAQCLVSNKSKLAPACRNEVTAVEARLKK